ncbi:hypothetical protein BVG81_009345 [Haliangium sp. UPWRP_2]|nr:hypothetical protein BVG81_009345 [Haliangium sp. UPWRP_2]
MAARSTAATLELANQCAKTGYLLANGSNIGPGTKKIEDGASQRNTAQHGEPAGSDLRVSEILRNKKGSIKNAPLEKGSPSWEEIQNMTWSEIERGAKENKPGYRTIRKLLSDSRFNK